MKKLRSKIFTFVLLCIAPYMLTQCIETESSTEFLWWEEVIAYVVIVSLYYTWIEYWYHKLITDKFTHKNNQP